MVGGDAGGALRLHSAFPNIDFQMKNNHTMLEKKEMLVSLIGCCWQGPE